MYLKSMLRHKLYIYLEEWENSSSFQWLITIYFVIILRNLEFILCKSKDTKLLKQKDKQPQQAHSASKTVWIEARVGMSQKTR